MANDDPAYLKFLHRQPCRGCGRFRDGTEPWVHHRRGAGMALRAPDREGMPLCGDGVRGCHGSLHNPWMKSGTFSGWDKQRLRDWEDEQVQHLQELYDDNF